MTQNRNRSWLPLTLVAAIAAAFLLPLWLSLSPVQEIPPSPERTQLPPRPPVVALPDFSKYKIVEKKKASFFDYLRPLVRHNNQIISLERAEVIALKEKASLLEADRKRLLTLAKKYRVKGATPDDKIFFDQLLLRIDNVPEALALAQAANESAWGTSRFARQGNNLFGEWCFSRGCGITPKRRAPGETHEVAKFQSVYDAVESYMLNLNRNQAYQELRKLRKQARDSGRVISGWALAQGLRKYSARGDDYVEEIRSMIRSNQLEAESASRPENRTAGQRQS